MVFDEIRQDVKVVCLITVVNDVFGKKTEIVSLMVKAVFNNICF